MAGLLNAQKRVSWKDLQGPEETLMEGQRGLDQGTRDLISQQLQTGTDTNGLVSNGLMGVQEAGSFGQNLTNEAAALSGVGGQGAIDAIQSKSKASVADRYNQMKREQEYSSQLGVSDSLAQGGKNLGQFENLKLGNYQQKMQALEMARERARQIEEERNSVLGSILGIFGTIGGALIAGPAGAAVGGAAGRAGGA